MLSLNGRATKGTGWSATALLTLALLSCSRGANVSGSDWPIAGHGYDNNRYVESSLSEDDVQRLSPAWRTPVVDDGEQEASPIVYAGTMYISTPHDNVLALDAKTGALKWQFPYTPADILDFAANRGVGVAGGKVFIGTQDCHILALDAATGKTAWNVAGCSNAANNWYSMPAYVYRNAVVIGVAGGDFGGNGSVQAFDATSGRKLWQWDTIPAAGEPGHNSWPGDSWLHGGAGLWGGLTIDPSTSTLYIAPGNPAPDFAPPKGADLYSDSVVALDISGAQPRMQWYYQIDRGDAHDADPAMPPVIFDGKLNGVTTPLLVVADKNGSLFVLNRQSGKLVHELAVTEQRDIDADPTPQGEVTCPNHGGGVEWLGGSYDPNTNLFIVPATKECGDFKSYPVQPPWKQGVSYRGGPPVARHKSTGLVTAVDISSGKQVWQKVLPYPAQGGALITSTGITFTSDLSGTLYALDTATGKTLWHYATGSDDVAPFSLYRVDGQEYLATVVGQAGNQTTPNLPPSKGSYVLAFRAGAASPVTNTSRGQTLPGLSGSGVVQTGSVPYTNAQVQAGKAQFAHSCAICHGDQLQGVSAPALAGSAFGKSHLTVAAMRTIVTKQMPLTAPGSLSDAQYANLMAFLLASNCVKPSGGGSQLFPTAGLPALQSVTLVGAVCSVK
jgi:alcohol dehydrogenase (cytochrome c)